MWDNYVITKNVKDKWENILYKFLLVNIKKIVKHTTYFNLLWLNVYTFLSICLATSEIFYVLKKFMISEKLK